MRAVNCTCRALPKRVVTGAIRNGLLEHLGHGKLSLLEFAVYVVLHMCANYETGVCATCALTLAYQTGDLSREKTIREALRRLKNKRYINYPCGRGAKGAYPILIDKYEPREGRWMGYRLNAWKHGASCRPEYEQQRVESSESRVRAAGKPSESSPNKEIRSKKEEKYTNENDLSNRTIEELRIMKRTFTRGGAKCPQSVLDELSKREREEVETQVRS